MRPFSPIQIFGYLSPYSLPKLSNNLEISMALLFKWEAATLRI